MVRRACLALPAVDRYQLLLVVLVVCTAPLIAARSIAAGIVCSLLAGLAIAPVFSCQYALVGRSVTPGSETEAFTWVSAALIGGLAAGLGDRRRGDRPRRRRRAVRVLVPSLAARRADRGRVPQPRPAARLNGSLAAAGSRPTRP